MTELIFTILRTLIYTLAAFQLVRQHRWQAWVLVVMLASSNLLFNAVGVTLYTDILRLLISLMLFHVIVRRK